MNNLDKIEDLLKIHGDTVHVNIRDTKDGKSYAWNGKKLEEKYSGRDAMVERFAVALQKAHSRQYTAMMTSTEEWDKLKEDKKKFFIDKAEMLLNEII